MAERRNIEAANAERAFLRERARERLHRSRVGNLADLLLRLRRLCRGVEPPPQSIEAGEPFFRRDGGLFSAFDQFDFLRSAPRSPKADKATLSHQFLLALPAGVDSRGGPLVSPRRRALLRLKPSGEESTRHDPAAEQAPQIAVQSQRRIDHKKVHTDVASVSSNQHPGNIPAPTAPDSIIDQPCHGTAVSGGGRAARPLSPGPPEYPSVLTAPWSIPAAWPRRTKKSGR